VFQGRRREVRRGRRGRVGERRGEKKDLKKDR
jgi:hypothetical protein